MRRRARECALQILYQLDVGGSGSDVLASGDDLDQALRRYWASFEPVSTDEQQFAERLARGVVASLATVDSALARASRNWKLARMGKVDRNLLRLAAYEIMSCPDIPRAASINEAVEIAKRFSGGESAAFVNGILDNLATDVEEESPDQ